MKKRVEVLWADMAEQDLIGIIEYIAQESKAKVLKVFTALKEKTSRLNSSPEQGRIVPELKEYGIIQYRELIVPPWRIIYRILENRVYVLSVIDARRNIEDVLLTRLTHQKI